MNQFAKLIIGNVNRFPKSLSIHLSLIRGLRNGNPPTSPFDDDDDQKPLNKREKQIIKDRLKLNWRSEVGDDPKFWQSKFRLFANEHESMDLLLSIQKPIDLSWTNWMQRREKKRVFKEKFMQQYVAERHRILGNDLAAAHFIVHRNGAVKFLNQQEWTQKDENNKYELPSHFDANYQIEAIRCDGMELYYEGLENIRRLNHLKYISFRNMKTFDDWCLDRVSGSQFTALEVLDLSGTAVTERGLAALYRLPTLKRLYLDNPAQSTNYELTCYMLYDIIPDLKICTSANSVSE